MFNLEKYKSLTHALCDKLYPKLQPDEYPTNEAFYNDVSKELFVFFLGDFKLPLQKPLGGATAPKSKSVKRARGVSVKPRTAYLNFYYSRKDELLAAGEDGPARQKTISAEWKNMSAEGKQPFIDMMNEAAADGDNTEEEEEDQPVAKKSRKSKKSKKTLVALQQQKEQLEKDQEGLDNISDERSQYHNVDPQQVNCIKEALQDEIRLVEKHIEERGGDVEDEEYNGEDFAEVDF